MRNVPRVAVGRLAVRDDDDGEESLRSTLQVKRRKSRRERASDAGVWQASLHLAVVACLVPAWFLGAALAFSHSATGSGDPAARAVQITFIALGTIAIYFGIRASYTLSLAPRLGRGHHRAVLRRLPIAAGVLAVLFLHRFVYNGAALSGDVFAYIGAMAPAALLCECSWALQAISKGRHGTAIASTGAIAWIVAALVMPVVGFVPMLWWVPVVVAAAGSSCTAPAAIRIWRHYEGEVVTA